MAAVLEDPCRAEQVGAEGQKVCLARLDFRQHATALSGFFTDCIKHHNARMTRDLLDNRSAMFVRNLFCRTVGMGIMLSGLVRRARINALQSGVVTSIYFHSPNQKLFTQCVRWLRTNGYTFITTQQLIDIVHGRLTAPRGAVWLSFDDGCRELLTSVLPVVYLEKVPIALFIPAGIVEGNGLFPWRCNTFNDNSDASANETLRHSVTVLELQEIARHPEVTIGSHTMSHTITPQLSEEALRSELKESKSKLESWSGTQVTSFAYPVGKYDGKEARILRECGYELAATTEASFVTHAAKAFEIPRFHVGDNIPFPEAACNMVGVWYPVVGPLYKFLRRCGAFAARFRRASPRLQLPEPQ
jgi:peptidoglycan/xylan/chitin deacetylase (PgdA/CDA1 family)